MSIVEDVGAPRRWLKSKGGPQGEGPQGRGPPDEAPQDAPLVGWLVAGGIAGLALLFDAASYLIADDGFALPDRAVWVRGGQEMGSAPWSQASGVTLGCEMQGRHSDSPTLIYQAHFPGGRSAKLGLGWASPQSVTNWLEAITPLDAALGKAPFEQGEMNARCLTAFNGAAGSEADQARLKALLRLP